MLPGYLAARFKTYRLEIDKLHRTRPDRYSYVRLLLQFPAWYHCLKNKSSPLQDGIPWITFEATKFLEKILRPDMFVFEFGSGGSSLFLAERVKRVYSVEHDEAWFAAVSSAVREKGYSNWAAQLAPPVKPLQDNAASPSDPEAYASGSPPYQGLSFEKYVKSIDNFRDGYFDLVLIDGRARPACFKHAIPKTKAGGYIMCDNTDRSYYLKDIARYENSLRRIDFPGPAPYVDFFTQTSVWRKEMRPGELTLMPVEDPLKESSIRKVVLGSAGIASTGWLATDIDSLNVVDRDSFSRLWEPDSIDIFLAEHVWEHLTQEEAQRANANCYEFLRPGGWLRIAVPDGFHPSPTYIEHVRPGGVGPGADDHKVLYTYRSLKERLEKQGFVVRLLEYWDEEGTFHFKEWSSEDGHVVRSRRYDPRNQDGSLTFTSLLVDAVKPLPEPSGGRTEKQRGTPGTLVGPKD